MNIKQLTFWEMLFTIALSVFALIQTNLRVYSLVLHSGADQRKHIKTQVWLNG